MRKLLLKGQAIVASILSLCAVGSYGQSTSFSYTGTIQSYTVPAGVTTIRISSSGARGGNISSHTPATGGSGAIIAGDFAVTPGQVLKVLVGGHGEDVVHAAGGGGGSFVWDNATNTLLVASGGGGGAGCSDLTGFGINGLDASITTSGVNGVNMPNGAGSAGSGGTAPSGSIFDYAAGGAGWLSNGADGTNIGFCTHPFPTGGSTALTGGAGGQYGGSAGLDGNGGFGGGGGAHGRCGAIGGGGGGGFSGGGAGGELNSAVNEYTAGGGGGSFNGGTNQSNTIGSTGDGVVVICAFAVPGTISGITSVCEGSNTELGSDGDAGGVWTSDATTIATVSSADGVVTGVSAGTANITYTVTNSCGSDFVAVTVTVNPLPGAITGSLAVCEMSSTTLSSTTSGGTWTSANSSIATIGSADGLLSGVAAGTTDITYTLPTTCMISQTVTVNPLPAAITGAGEVCAASMITLADATAGGTWTSSVPAVATVGSAGDVTGASAGTADIMYTLPTGCYVSHSVTVYALPAVSGGSSVAICYGASAGLTATGADNYIWSPADGLSCTNCASPVASPTVTTTYTVTGTEMHGVGSFVYSQAFVSGVIPTSQCTAWDAFRTSLLGTYTYSGFTIRGSMNSTGISCTDPVVANAVADALRNGTFYSGSSDGQTWTVGIGCTTGPCGTVAVELSNIGSCSCATGYSIRPSINNANWGGIDGPTCSASSQTMEVVFYYDVASCSNSSVVTVSVNPLPAVYNVTGGGSYCAGGTGVSVGLDSANGGINYQLYNGMATVGSAMPGMEAPLDFGLQTAGGTYTVMAIDSTTGCTSAMNGSATVTVIPVVVPSVGISRSTSDTICDGTHTTFTASPVNEGTAPHYIWTVDGVVMGADSIAFDYVPADTDMISVTLVSNATCAIPDTVNSDTLTMIVFPNGTPAVNLTVSPNDTVCDGTSVTVTANPTFGGYGPSYTWVKNTAVVGSGATYSYMPVDGDDIYAIMNSDYMCRLANTAYSNVIHMTVEDPIVPAVSISGNPGVIVPVGHADTLVAAVINGGTNPSYQWLINGVAVPGATNATFIRSSYVDGDSVSCLVTRMDACQLSTINSVVIHVSGLGVATTGNLVADITLMPNPNKGVFSLKGALSVTADEEVTADVTNMLGQVVYSANFATVHGNIDHKVELGNTLASGIYILSLHSSKGNKVFHFVVEQ